MPSLNQTTQQVSVFDKLIDKIGNHLKASSQYKLVVIDTGECSLLRLVLKK
jgi:hypothetical protein